MALFDLDLLTSTLYLRSDRENGEAAVSTGTSSFQMQPTGMKGAVAVQQVQCLVLR